MPGGDYDAGMDDGLRLALSILVAEEAKWAERMNRARSRKTLAVQAVRHKAYQVAQTRIQTALNRRGKRSAPGATGAHVDRQLRRLGL